MNRQCQIGSHLFRYLDGKVLQQSTVRVDGVLSPDGRKDSRQRHGGPQGHGQGSVAENLGLATDQVGSYACERSWEIVEALDLRVRKGDLIENQRDLLAGVEALGKLQAFAQPKFQVVGIVAGVFLAPKREGVEGRLPRHDLVPGDLVHDLAHLSSIVSGGIDPANQAAHAGAGDIVKRNVVFLQPGNDTHVGKSQRPTALEHQAYGRTL